MNQQAVRRGFTLVEILISIMIFSIVAVAMVTILFMASSVYRQGEYSRAAGDEAIAVLATIDSDLQRLVPAADGGFFFADMDDDAGNCRVAFTTTPENVANIAANGAQSRRLVVYAVDTNPGSSYKNRLSRWEGEAPAAFGPDVHVNAVKILMGQNRRTITNGCLHFGVWSGEELDPRKSLAEWLEVKTGAGETIPNRTNKPDICTEATTLNGNLIAADTYPSNLRISLILSGNSRYAPKGLLRIAIGAADLTPNVRITGIGSIPTSKGSLLRIGDEWFEIGSVRSNLVSLSGREALRSVKKDHPMSSQVSLGQSYSLVRTLP